MNYTEGYYTEGYYSDKRYLWHIAGAVEWLGDNVISLADYCGEGDYYGYQGIAEGNGYIYTDGTSHGHYEGYGNGWGYCYSNEGGAAYGKGEGYVY